MNDFQCLVGKTIKDAKNFISEPYWLCTVSKDDDNFIITANLDFNRIKIKIKNGIIIEVLGIG